jgi:hypothetical protein
MVGRFLIRDMIDQEIQKLLKQRKEEDAKSIFKPHN